MQVFEAVVAVCGSGGCLSQGGSRVWVSNDKPVDVGSDVPWAFIGVRHRVTRHGFTSCAVTGVCRSRSSRATL